MSALRVLHVSLNVSHVGGGVAAYIWKVTKALHVQGVVNSVAGVEDSYLEHDASEHLKHVKLVHGRLWLSRNIGFAPKLWGALSQEIAEVDLVHIHGLRASILWRAASYARNQGVPIVISPHGQLHPWLLNQRRMRKQIVDTLFTRPNIRQCARLHAVSEPEAQDIREYYPRARVTTVPIGIDPNPYLKVHAPELLRTKYPELTNRKLLVYCSIMTPRKGLPMLSAAWSRLAQRYPQWHLVIAGMDLDGYMDTVKRDFAVSVNNGTASILGRITEQEKAGLLQAAELLVLPTLSEAFGMIVLESMSSATPVLTTTSAPWSHLPKRGCGWSVKPNVEEITEALQQAMSISDEERAAMGSRGRELVLNEYTWESSAKQMIAMYQEVIDERKG